jgi:hypothetical protein
MKDGIVLLRNQFEKCQCMLLQKKVQQHRQRIHLIYQ